MGIVLGIVAVVGLTVAYRKYTKHMRERLKKTQLELGDVTEDRDMTRGLLDDTRVEVEERIREVESLQEGWRIDPIELTLVSYVARGGQGIVYRGIFRNFDVAVKAMRRDPDKPADHGFSNAEVQAMQRLRSQFLVYFYGVGQLVPLNAPKEEGGNGGDGNLGRAVPKIRKPTDFDDDIYDFVCLEWMQRGTLASALRRIAKKKSLKGTHAVSHVDSSLLLTWEGRLQCLCDIATGMAEIHSKQFVHRDLKPDNVLIGAHGRCKIADLGLARFHSTFEVDWEGKDGAMRDEDVEATVTEFTQAGVGTPKYMAPEVVATRLGTYDRTMQRALLQNWHAPDSYAFACVMWEVLTLRKLWAGQTNTHDLWRAVCAGERPEIQHEEVTSAPEDYVALMRDLWSQDLKARPTFPQAVDRLDAMRKRAMAAAPGGGGGGKGRSRSNSAASASDSSSLSKAAQSRSKSGVPESYSEIVASFSQKSKGIGKASDEIEKSFADVSLTAMSLAATLPNVPTGATFGTLGGLGRTKAKVKKTRRRIWQLKRRTKRKAGAQKLEEEEEGDSDAEAEGEGDGGGEGGGGGALLLQRHGIPGVSTDLHKHCNWMRVAYSLKYMCEGLIPFVERSITAAQQRSVAHFAAQTPPVACTHKSGDVFRPAGRSGTPPASCASCETMLEHFTSLHRHAKRKGRSRKVALNIFGGHKNKYSCWRWGSVDGAWDVARLFNRQPTPAAAARTADCSALLAVMCFYEGAFAMRKHQPVETAIKKVQEVRNGSFGHVQACELDDATTTYGVDIVLRLLREARRGYRLADGSEDAGFVAATAKINTMLSTGDRYFH